ncbi:MAG: ornithine cyclodeaminase family protein [Hyphomicrobiales bacterium]|nr:ornithine cyclodeaminase family protein [Hyphomicrobiales bacterium]MDE2113569.1 ornithine cyclodeaminase family protein [Hyphomicrobiales bacterium]
MPRVISADEMDRVLDFPGLREALRLAFAGGMSAPERLHYGLGEATLLLMPAWTQGTPQPNAVMGTKIVSVFPGNGALGLPAVNGLYVLQSGHTGAPLAVLDGARLTQWRTAAASALAAQYLARAGAETLTMVGAGSLAPFLIRAHASVRPLRHVTIWNHNGARALQLAAQMAGASYTVSVSDDLQAACASADIISCATLSREPLVRGEWLKPGTHLDLVGAFTPAMREVDDDTICRASVYLDTPAALTEGGDIAIAISKGVIQDKAVIGDLSGLCRGDCQGRRDEDEITLFKSLGAAVEDLAAAALVWQRMTPGIIPDAYAVEIR